jgi:hypothetical protein
MSDGFFEMVNSGNPNNDDWGSDLSTAPLPPPLPPPAPPSILPPLPPSAPLVVPDDPPDVPVESVAPVSNTLPARTRRRKNSKRGWQELTDQQKETLAGIIAETLPPADIQFSDDDSENLNRLLFNYVSRAKDAGIANTKTIDHVVMEFYEMLPTEFKTEKWQTLERYQQEGKRIVRLAKGAKKSVLLSSGTLAQQRIDKQEYSWAGEELRRYGKHETARLLTFLEEMQLSQLSELATKGTNGVFYCSYHEMAKFLKLKNDKAAYRIAEYLRDTADFADDSNMEDCGYLRLIEKGTTVTKQVTKWTVPHSGDLMLKREKYGSWLETPLVSTYLAFSPGERRTLTLGLAWQDMERERRQRAKQKNSYSIFFGGKLNPNIRQQEIWKRLSTVREWLEGRILIKGKSAEDVTWQNEVWQKYVRGAYQTIMDRNTKAGKKDPPYVSQIMDEGLYDVSSPLTIRPPLLCRQLYWELFPDAILEILGYQKPPVGFFE